jgi:hypothetical protein
MDLGLIRHGGDMPSPGHAGEFSFERHHLSETIPRSAILVGQLDACTSDATEDRTPPPSPRRTSKTGILRGESWSSLMRRRCNVGKNDDLLFFESFKGGVLLMIGGVGAER